jgi:hypothetical protein
MMHEPFGKGVWSVAFTPAWDDVKSEGRSQEEIMADAQRLDALTLFMPDGLIRDLVGRYLSDARKKSAFGELGNPAEFAGFLTDRLRRAERYPGADRFERDAKPRPPERAIETESRLVARQLTLDWVDSILLAWRRWGRSAGVLELDDTFTPQPATSNLKAHWERWYGVRQEAIASALSTIAVTDGDRDRIMPEFWTRLRESLHTKRAVELPERVDLVLRDKHAVAMRRGR